MISGLVPFEEVLEAVKDESAIENLSPHYERIRRLLFRAEAEIGYGGSVVLKKMIFTKDSNYNGKYIPFPPDFIELEGIGQYCCAMNPYEYTVTSDGIRFRKTQDVKTCLLYWALFCDGHGNPVTTRNHFEAVVAYIVWKLYSPKIFLGVGNMNAAQDYKYSFQNLLHEARGDDAFPTMEQWNEIGLLSYSDRRALLMHPIASYNYCSDEILQDCPEIVPEATYVYYWQLNGTIADIQDEINNITEEYLLTKPRAELLVFEMGKKVDYLLTGRPCFAIRETEDMDFQITDALNLDITDEYDTQYFPEIKTMLFVAKNYVIFSSIYFKFKNIIQNV